MILSKILEESIMSEVSFYLSLATLAASLYVFWRYDKRLNKQNIRINEFTIQEMNDKEEDLKKAEIDVHHEYSGKGNGYLIISNTGKCEARNLTLTIEGKEDSGIYWRLSNIFPYSCLTSGASIKIHYGLNSGFQADPILHFIWNDDSGKIRTAKHSVFLG